MGNTQTQNQNQNQVQGLGLGQSPSVKGGVEEKIKNQNVEDGVVTVDKVKEKKKGEEKDKENENEKYVEEVYEKEIVLKEDEGKDKVDEKEFETENKDGIKEDKKEAEKSIDIFPPPPPPTHPHAGDPLLVEDPGKKINRNNTKISYMNTGNENKRICDNMINTKY